MEKARNSSQWVEEGYTLFAKEGPDGIQIERLARILQLNKSGFYHYFGDLEGFFEHLLNKHTKKAELYLADIRKISTIDPEYLHLLVKHKMPTLFHMQLIRNKENPLFANLIERIDREERNALQELWSDFLGFHDEPALAMRYFDLINGKFYSRVSFSNFDYPFICGLITEAKVLMQQIVEQGTLREGNSLV